MAALTKIDLAKELSQKMGLTLPQTKEIVELFFEEIRKSLERGQNVYLSGFGNFSLRDKKQRLGRNPKTGQAHEISKRRVANFKTGIKLQARLKKELINQSE